MAKHFSFVVHLWGIIFFLLQLNALRYGRYLSLYRFIFFFVHLSEFDSFFFRSPKIRCKYLFSSSVFNAITGSLPDSLQLLLFFFFLLAKEHNETKMVLEYALINQRTTFHVIFGLFHRSRNCSNRNIINAAFYRMFTM